RTRVPLCEACASSLNPGRSARRRRAFAFLRFCASYVLGQGAKMRMGPPHMRILVVVVAFFLLAPASALAACPCTLFSDVSQPAAQNLPVQDGRIGPGPWSYEFGVKATVDQPMQLTAIRFYKAPLETGLHTGKVWTASGTLVAQVDFSGETASGWQQQTLPAPLALQVGV